jgi:hypothetical protein
MLPLVDSAERSPLMSARWLHRLQRDEAGAAAHLDVAVRGLDADVAADAVHGHVGVGAGHGDRHPRRHADGVVERAGRAAAQRARPDAQRLLDRLDVDRFTVGVVDLDANRVLAPHLDDDVAGEVVDVELGAFGDLHRLIGRRDRHHRQ